jgi:hypothetical protein
VFPLGSTLFALRIAEHWPTLEERLTSRFLCQALCRKNALVAADMLNDRVLPFFEEQQVPL